MNAWTCSCTPAVRRVLYLQVWRLHNTLSQNLPSGARAGDMSFAHAIQDPPCTMKRRIDDR